jgi:WD40 repeat protein/flagellar biosynthesis GTPase FlhF
MENSNQQRSKSTVFLSYAREDKEFMRVLKAALEERGVETRGDWELTTGEDYAMRLREFNLGAHALVFVITPDSIRSEACRNELALAVEHKKQILPVSRREHGDDNLLDSALRAPQWTFLREGDDFERGIGELVKAINTDFALMDIHGRLLVAADNWDRNRRNRSYLLRKDGLKNAEAWLAVTSAQPDKLPQPTPLEIEFIFSSRRARSRGTRIGLGLATAVALALAALSVVALAQRSQAVANALKAESNAEEARRNATEANVQKTKAQDNETKAIANAEEAERRKKEAEANAAEAERQRNQAVAARLAERQQREEADKQRGLAVEGRKEAETQTGVARTRLASIYWNNGVKAREQGQPILAAHQFMRAAEAFSQVNDEASSRNAQLAAEFLVGDYELQGMVEMKGVMWGALFDPKQTGLALWSYDEIHNFAGTTSLGTWDVDRREFRSTPASLPERIRDCLMNPDALLLCWTQIGYDKSATHVWESATGREVFEPVRFESDDMRFKGAEFSHDRKRILAWVGSSDTSERGEGFARIYDALNGTPLTTPLEHGKVVNGATFSRDDSRVLTWGSDGFVKIWRSADGSLLSSLNMGDKVKDALLSPDESRLVAWGGKQWGGVAQLWDARTGEVIGPHLEHAGLVTGARFNADGSQLLTWSNDEYSSNGVGKGSARVWDAATGKPLTPHLNHEGHVGGAQFSADGKHVMTWGRDRAIRLWYISDRGESAFPKPLLHAADIIDAHYTPDGASIVSVTKDGAIHFWNASTGILVSEHILNQQPIRGQSFTNDLRTLATFGFDGTTRIWRRREGREFVATMRHPGAGGHKLNRDGTRLLTWDGKGEIRLWDTRTGDEVAIQKQTLQPEGPAQPDDSERPEEKEHHQIHDVVFSPDGRHALVLNNAVTSRGRPDESYVMELETGERVGAGLGRGEGIKGAVYSPDDSTILTWSEGWSNEEAAYVYYARVWDGSTGLPVTPPIKHARPILQAAFGPGANTVLTFDFESLRAWDAKTGRAVPLPSGLSWRGGGGEFDKWAFHGYRLATVGEDAVVLKDASTGRTLRSAPAGIGTWSLFSRDGSRLFVVFEDVVYENAAEVWDTATGKVLSVIKSGKRFNVRSAAMTADGGKVLTWAGVDRALHLWASDTGKELIPPLHDPQGFSEAMFSADEKRIMTHGSGGLRLWDAQTGEPLTASLQSDGMNSKFTPDETRMLAHSFRVAEVRDGRTGQLILPPLRLRWPNDDINRESGGELVSEDGTRIVDWNNEGRIRVWNLWTEYDWPRDQLRLRLEAMTGTRLNSFDEIELLSREDWEKARNVCDAIRHGLRPGV